MPARELGVSASLPAACSTQAAHMLSAACAFGCTGSSMRLMTSYSLLSAGHFPGILLAYENI